MEWIYSSPPLIKQPYYNENVTSVEGDNLVVFYHVGASQIWPDKRGGVLCDNVLIRGELQYLDERLCPMVLECSIINI